MKSLKYFCALCAVTLCLVLPAAAVDYTYCADALFDMGFFMGTENGYELDRVPTRTEAAVMLVRLLGKSEEALSADHPHPFTDVPQWASPYVGWLFYSGLAKGNSPTLFDSEKPCDLQMYSTFILRSLGHDDSAKGDFTYEKAIDFAKSLNIFDNAIATAPFMRNELVAVSYSALATKLSGSDAWLLEKLNSEGALTSEAAKPHFDSMMTYKKLLTAAAKLDSTVSLAMTNQTPSMGYDGKIDISTTKIKFSSAKSSSHFAQSFSVSTDGKPENSFFYLDGYMHSIDKKEMWKADPTTVNVSGDIFPYYYVQSVKTDAAKPGGDTAYTVTFYDHLASAWGFAPSLSSTLSGMNHTYVLSSRDELVRRTANVLLSLENSRNYLTSDIEVVARGGNVLISLPNLSGYVDLTEHMGK